MTAKHKEITVETFQGDSDLREWLEQKAAEHGLDYLLAYADDGVIWGHFKYGNKLTTSGEVLKEVAVPLRLITLQQLRLFGPAGEILLWRSKEGFSGSEILDGSTDSSDGTFEEAYRLWGEGVDGKSQQGFTLMHEGREGLRHAPPVENVVGASVKLIVRHYINYDEQGQAYVAHSRLVNLAEDRRKS